MIKTRKHLRVPLPIKVKFRRDGSNAFEDAKVGDISWGGIYLCVPEPPPQKSRVLLELDIPDQAVMLEIWGNVVRVHQGDAEFPPGVGVEFDEIDHEGRSAIQSLVDHFVHSLVQKTQ